MSIDSKILHRLDRLDEESKLRILDLADSILEQKNLPPVKDVLEIHDIEEGLKRVCKDYPVVKSVGIFGSYARGEADEESDLDFAVEFKDKISLMKVLGLKTKLEAYFGRYVDLLDMSQADTEIKKRIVNDVVILYEGE